MTPSDAQALLEPAATQVRDPKSGRSLWLAGLIKNPNLNGETLSFDLELNGHSEDERERMKTALIDRLSATGFEGKVAITVKVRNSPPAAAAPAATPTPKPKDPVRGMSGPGMQPHGGPITKKPIPGVRHVVAIASGKGGVGKSTLAANLAVAMAQSGLRVGLMDADIYGPSMPLMMNVHGKPYADANQRILPLEGHGVRIMSIGLLVDDSEPIIWRGPMVMGVVKQFLHDVAWGDLDVLLIDLPPGTGDAQLTMIQAVELSGAIVITTPQEVAVIDAVRGIEMFKKLDVPVLGVVENMAWLDMPGTTRSYPFGEGGGRRTAERYKVPLLAQVPLDSRIREGGDHGVPAAVNKDGPGQAFHAIAALVWSGLAAR